MTLHMLSSSRLIRRCNIVYSVMEFHSSIYFDTVHFVVVMVLRVYKPLARTSHVLIFEHV